MADQPKNTPDTPKNAPQKQGRALFREQVDVIVTEKEHRKDFLESILAALPVPPAPWKGEDRTATDITAKHVLLAGQKTKLAADLREALEALQADREPKKAVKDIAKDMRAYSDALKTYDEEYIAAFPLALLAMPPPALPGFVSLEKERLALLQMRVALVDLKIAVADEKKFDAERTGDFGAYVARLAAYKAAINKVQSYGVEALPALPKNAPRDIDVAYHVLGGKREKIAAIAGEVILLVDDKELPKQRQTEFEALKKEYDRVLALYKKNIGEFDKNPVAYRKKLDGAVDVFRERLGLKGIDPKEFAELLMAATSPVEEPPKPGDKKGSREFSGKECDNLAKFHKHLGVLSEQFGHNLSFQLFQIMAGDKVDEAEYQQWLESFVALLSERRIYQCARFPSDKRPPNLLLLYLGVVVNEAAEELAEAAWEESRKASAAAFTDKFAKLAAKDPAFAQRLSSALANAVSRDGVIFLDGLKTIAVKDPRLLENILKGLEKKLGGEAGKRVLSLQQIATMSEAEIKAVMDGIHKSLGRGAPFVNNIPGGLESLDPATRRKLIDGLIKAEQQLAAQGVSSKEFRDMLKRLKFERSMLKGLIDTITNPATIIIFGMYLADSEDKVKGALKYGAFMAISHGANKAVNMTAVKAAEAAYARKLAKAGIVGEAQAAKLAQFSAVCKHPVLQFAIALLAVFGMEYIGATDGIVDWVDKNMLQWVLPHGQWREGVSWGLEVVTLQNVGVWKDDYLRAIDVSRINPERDVIRYFYDAKAPTLSWPPQSTYTKNSWDWNKEVVRVSTPQMTGNRVKQNLYMLNVINEAWFKRQAVEIYGKIGCLRLNAEELMEKIKDKDGYPDREEFQLAVDGLLDAITTDKSANSRNDLVLSWLISDAGHSGVPGDAKAKKAFHKLHKLMEPKITERQKALREIDKKRKEDSGYKPPETTADEEIVDMYDRFFSLAKDVSTRIGLFRHLQLPDAKDGTKAGNGKPAYTRETWLGDMKKMTPYVEQGFVAEVGFQIKQKRIKDMPANTPLKDAIAALDPLMAFSFPEVKTDLPGEKPPGTRPNPYKDK